MDGVRGFRWIRPGTLWTAILALIALLLPSVLAAGPVSDAAPAGTTLIEALVADPPRLRASTYAPSSSSDRDRIEGYGFAPSTTVVLTVDFGVWSGGVDAGAGGRWRRELELSG